MDTNILVYAADESHEAHPRCRELLESWREGESPWHLTWGIVYEFMRVTTHPKVFRNPLSTPQALEFIARLMESPQLSVLLEGSGHLEAIRKITAEFPTLRGNLIHDAHTVALMREHAIARIYTRDTDFLRFSGIEVMNPLDTP